MTANRAVAVLNLEFTIDLGSFAPARNVVHGTQRRVVRAKILLGFSSESLLHSPNHFAFSNSGGGI